MHWGRSCFVEGPSGVPHQIDVTTAHSDGVHRYRTGISWNEPADSTQILGTPDWFHDAKQIRVFNPQGHAGAKIVVLVGVGTRFFAVDVLPPLISFRL